MRSTSWSVGDYKITSYGNGTAYSIARNGDDKEVFFQGEDATEWRIDYDNTHDAIAFLNSTWEDYAEFVS